MAAITLKGNAIDTIGDLPAVGTQATNFKLVKSDLSTCSLADFKGKKLIMNIFPSIDTGTCATSVRKFNKEAASFENAIVLCISRDLPFAQKRFCGAEGVENVVMASDFVNGAFGQNYNLTMVNGPLANLHSRSIIVLDENHKVLYSEQVSDIVDEPNYMAAITALG